MDTLSLVPSPETRVHGRGRGPTHTGTLSHPVLPSLLLHLSSLFPCLSTPFSLGSGLSFFPFSRFPRPLVSRASTTTPYSVTGVRVGPLLRGGRGPTRRTWTRSPVERPLAFLGQTRHPYRYPDYTHRPNSYGGVFRVLEEVELGKGHFRGEPP